MASNTRSGCVEYDGGWCVAVKTRPLPSSAAASVAADTCLLMTQNLTPLRRHTNAPLLEPARVGAEGSLCVPTHHVVDVGLAVCGEERVEDSRSVIAGVGRRFT
jgi:hypothetical protein